MMPAPEIRFSKSSNLSPGVGQCVLSAHHSFKDFLPVPLSTRTLAICCAFACLLIASSAFMGWWLGVPILTTFVPGGASMFPLTATGFVGVSVCLFLQASFPAQHPASVRLVATGIVCLGLISCILRAARWTPGPLNLAVGADATAWSLPASTTSVLFIALGLSLALMNMRKGAGLAQAIAVATLLGSLLATLSYLSRSTILYALIPGKGTGLPTALAFMLAAGGSLFVRPAEGPLVALSNSLTGRRTVRQLLLPTLSSPILLGLLVTGVSPGLDVDSATWLMVWGLLIILTVVIWRFAYQLQQQEIARRVAEAERSEALQALRQADERKDQFLAMLAHELRNPLAPIQSAADLLNFCAANADQVRRTSAVISRQVDHMVHLVDDLLDVSRVTRGIIELKKERLDARRLVMEALEQVQPLLEMKQHRLHAHLPDFPVPIEGDHKRLVQVLANLLNNAGKYTPEGGDLSVHLETGDGGVVISVKDNGIGIATDLLPDVFQVFTQAKRTPDRRQGGLGLGLALVKSLVELHGGRVTARSEGIGMGSVFTVVLPHALPAEKNGKGGI